MNGRIVRISFEKKDVVYLTRGINQENRYMFQGRFPGGNGTYVIGGEYNSFIMLKIFVYDLGKSISIDIKENVLLLNNRKRVSSQMIDTLIKNNVGRKVKFYLNDKGIYFPDGELNLIV